MFFGHFNTNQKHLGDLLGVKSYTMSSSLLQNPGIFYRGHGIFSMQSIATMSYTPQPKHKFHQQFELINWCKNHLQVMITWLRSPSNEILVDKPLARQNKLVQEVQENISSLKLVPSREWFICSLLWYVWLNL